MKAKQRLWFFLGVLPFFSACSTLEPNLKTFPDSNNTIIKEKELVVFKIIPKSNSPFIFYFGDGKMISISAFTDSYSFKKKPLISMHSISSFLKKFFMLLFHVGLVEYLFIIFIATLRYWGVLLT